MQNLSSCDTQGSFGLAEFSLYFSFYDNPRWLSAGVSEVAGFGAPILPNPCSNLEGRFTLVFRGEDLNRWFRDHVTGALYNQMGNDVELITQGCITLECPG